MSNLLAALVAMNLAGAFLGTRLYTRQKMHLAYAVQMINGLMMITVNTLITIIAPVNWPVLGYLLLGGFLVYEGCVGITKARPGYLRQVVWVGLKKWFCVEDFLSFNAKCELHPKPRVTVRVAMDDAHVVLDIGTESDATECYLPAEIVHEMNSWKY